MLLTGSILGALPHMTCNKRELPQNQGGVTSSSGNFFITGLALPERSRHGRVRGMTVSVTWCNPPDTPVTFKRDLDEVVSALHRNPNRWAVVGESASSNAAGSRRARYRRYYPDCEFVTRSNIIYGRYVPRLDK